MPAAKNNKYAVGNKGGRPTKLTPEVFEKATGYLESCKETKNSEGAAELPTLAGMAVWLHVSKDSLKRWAEANEEFCAMLGDIAEEQEKRLINHGLTGKYNGNLAKFILSARHEYREKSDMTTDGKALPTPLLNAVLSNNSNTQSDGDAKED